MSNLKLDSFVEVTESRRGIVVAIGVSIVPGLNQVVLDLREILGIFGFLPAYFTLK